MPKAKLALFLATVISSPLGVAFALKFDQEPYPYPYQPAFIGSPEDPQGTAKVSQIELQAVFASGAIQRLAVRDVIPHEVGSRDWAVDQSYFILSNCFMNPECAHHPQTRDFLRHRLSERLDLPVHRLHIEWRTIHISIDNPDITRTEVLNAVDVELADG